MTNKQESDKNVLQKDETSPPPNDKQVETTPTPPAAKQKSPRANSRGTSPTTRRPTQAALVRQPSIPPTDDPFLDLLAETNTDEIIVETKEEETETRTDTIPIAETTKIVNSIAEKYQTTTILALTGITKLVQDGGTNATKKQLKRTVNNIEFDINDLRSTIQFHYKPGTVRKLAKTIRDTIAHIAKLNNWTGPLVRDLQRLEPQLIISPEDSIYCCEIHSDNYSPQVPAIIREALQRREKTIRDQNRAQPSKTKNKKSKKGKK
jgi:hypothetical protein